MRNTIWASLLISILIAGFVMVNFNEDKFMATMLSSGFIGEKAEISEEEFQEAFTDFLATYKKSYYNSYEFENRFMIFRDNYQMISDHNLNADYIGFEMGVNEFADLTSAEFQEKYLGLNQPRRHHKGHHKGHRAHKNKEHKEFNFETFFNRKAEEVEEDFTDFSWRDQGKVHSVKNQKACGSCWAFSAIGSIESAYAISHDTEPADLSEQQLVDCSTSFGNQGCEGGWMDQAFEYAETEPLCSESEYSYTAHDDKCKIGDENFHCTDGIKVKDYVDVTVNSKQALKEALDVGPVSVAVDATVWQFYFGGVMRWLCASNLNHGVLATGYGHGGLIKTDYWEIKNSWGSGWGEKGYIRVKANENKHGGTCGVLAAASYPIVE